MSYVRYNESLYRTGFRPMGTNPRAAVTLSGAIDHGWGSFGPWVLHGVDGDPVFTPRGGYALHGLGAGAGVPAGSIVSYKGVWTSVFNTGQGYHQQGDPQSIADGVVAALNQDGQLTVLQAPQGLSSIGNLIGLTGPFNVTLKIQVTNGMGFANVNDLISIIRHYVYQVSGVFPQSDAITQVQAPSGGDSTSPDYQGAGLMSTPGLPSAVPQPEDWGTWLQDNFGLIAGVIAGLVIVPPILKRIF